MVNHGKSSRTLELGHVSKVSPSWVSSRSMAHLEPRLGRSTRASLHRSSWINGRGTQVSNHWREGVPMATLAVGEFKWIYDNFHFWRPIFFLYSQASLILLLLTRSGIGKATPSITIDLAGHWFYTPKHCDRENMRKYLQKLSAKSWRATVKAATSCRSAGFVVDFWGCFA